MVDYCQSQYLIANCSRPGEVVLMKSARYGRMTLGRCGTGGSTNVAGCSEDVLWYLDQRCSGRRHCKVYVADPVLHRLNPCDSDYSAYLQAKYTCVSGINSRSHRLPLYMPHLTLWHPQYHCNFWHPGTMTLRAERQSGRMSKITNDSLTRSGTYMAAVGVKGLSCYNC